MATATAGLACKLPPAEKHRGPFDVWHPFATDPDLVHRLAPTLNRARDLAEHDSAADDDKPPTRIQVFDADHHLVAWAKGGHWHGPEVA